MFTVSRLALMPFAVCMLACARQALDQGPASPPPTQVEDKTSQTSPMIPRDVLFGNPDKAGLQLSPDGTHLMFLAPVEGVQNVWVGPSSDISAAQPITKDTGRGIMVAWFAYDNQTLLYLQDQGGDENWHIFGIDLKTAKITDFTPFEKIQARVVQMSHQLKTETLIAINDRDARYHDLYRLNLATGTRKLVFLNKEGFSEFVADQELNLRLVARQTPSGGVEYLERKGKKWAPFMQFSQADGLTSGVVGFDVSGQKLFFNDSRDRETAALMAMDMRTRKSTLIADDARVNVGDVVTEPMTGAVQAVSFTRERASWKIVDERIRSDFDHLKTVSEGDFFITSKTLDDGRWLVTYVSDRGPVRIFDYNRKDKQAKLSVVTRPELEKHALTAMHPITIKSRDGLELVSYLSLPRTSDPDRDGRPNRALPLVLDVHGGPWARDEWGYNSVHQWLADRGYAVLSVNFRGSTGFTKSFTNAGDNQWGKAMHNDLIDAVDWAVAERIADPSKVAIMGGSYGGYATLVGLTFTPEKFACGVDIVGPSSLLTLLESIPPYWQPRLATFKARVGNPDTEDGAKALREASPLFFVDRIRRPLLIGQGANDPRVKQAEADQIVAAMQEKNIPVTYLLYPDEGHGFVRPENRLSFWATTEAFLGKCLGGRVEPIGNSFKGSSIDVRAGVQELPELETALKTTTK